MDYKQRAMELHQNCIVIDTHLDLASEIYNRYMAGQKEIIKNNYLEEFKKAGYNVVVSSLYIDDMFLPEMALKMALGQIGALMEDVETCEGEVVIAKNKKDLNEIVNAGKIAIIISFEGLDPIGTDIGLLYIFHQLGVIGAGLVWSRRNYVADGCNYRQVEEGQRGGLTRFGVKVVKKLEEMNMFIDVSHLNDEGFWDVVKYTQKPFIASHSCVRNIHGSMRNLTDEQIKAIASRGGVIGINAVKSIAGIKDGDDNIAKLCDHVEYIVKLVGAEHVGYGFDLCDRYYNSEPRFDVRSNISDAISGHAGSLLLTEELLKRGLSEKEIKLIIGGNFFKIFNEILK